MLRIRTSVIRGLRALFPHALTRGKGATIPLNRILHIACCAPTLLIASRLRCPAYQKVIDITFNYAHHWWYFTSWLSRHNCIILRIRTTSSYLVANVIRGSDETPLRVTWLIIMCAYARRCFASCTNSIHPIDGSHVYLLMQQPCIITAVRREPLTSEDEGVEFWL
jgi:hypothetical protein